MACHEINVPGDCAGKKQRIRKHYGNSALLISPPDFAARGIARRKSFQTDHK
jgi:hypothetical protein